MADPEKISIVRKFIRWPARFVATVVKGIDLPAHLSRLLYEKFGGRRLCWIAVAVVAVGFIIFLAAWLHPDRLSYDYWRGVSNDSRSVVFRNFGLVFAAFVAGGLAVWRSLINERQAHTAEQGQITDRYSEAVKMLSADNARTRTGAVYALARIAQDSIERDHIPVMEVLAEFIRNPPYQDEADERATLRQGEALEFAALRQSKAAELGLVSDTVFRRLRAIECPDIHAAINVMADRNKAQRARENAAEFGLTFENAALRELNLSGANLSKASFNTDYHSCAILSGADLFQADLTEANLTGATLFQADLAEANLTGADLSGASLFQASLPVATLIDAYLIGADLRGANLNGADLRGANLTGADLTGADLTGASLPGADLTGANLTGANLSRATITRARLTNAIGLTQEQITGCNPGAPPTDLPNDLDWPFVMSDGDVWVQKG